MKEVLAFLAALKEHIRDNRANFIDHNSWLGDTEGGFYSTDEFNMDDLLREMDKFAATFTKQPESGESHE